MFEQFIQERQYLTNATPVHMSIRALCKTGVRSDPDSATA